MKKEIKEGLRRFRGLSEADDLGDFLGKDKPEPEREPFSPGFDPPPGYVGIQGQPPPRGTVRQILKSFGLDPEEVEEIAQDMDAALDAFGVPRDQQFTLYQGPDFENWEQWEEFQRDSLGGKKRHYDSHGQGGFFLHDDGVLSVEGEGAAWVFA